MRRPLPPELVMLGDQLEIAARRAIGHRHTRRQAFLNALTSLLIVLPLLPAVLGVVASPIPPPTALEEPARPGLSGARDDVPPRALRGTPSPSGDQLSEFTTLRRALR